MNLCQNVLYLGRDVLFGLALVCAAGTAAILFYYFHLRPDDAVNSVTIFVFCGLVFTALIIVRFVEFSTQFDNLERKQIKMIKNQQIFLQHNIILCARKGQQQKREEYLAIKGYLDCVVETVRETSISPKIAGLTLDKAFVKLFVSTAVGTATAVFSYEFKYLLNE